jgi:hypothetical protein
MSFEEIGNLTSCISKFLVQNILFLTPNINLDKFNLKFDVGIFLGYFFLARLIKYMVMKHFILRNSCMLYLKKY